jgi:hypothetical protein
MNYPCARRIIVPLRTSCGDLCWTKNYSTAVPLIPRLLNTLLFYAILYLQLKVLQTLSRTIADMIYRVISILVGFFALSAVSTPHPDQTEKVSQTTALTDQILVSIAPTTASCAGAEFPEECADAMQAAKAINKAFEIYKISSPGQRAGLVAYMLFESGNFKYNKNHYPGRPGQGTRMMAMPSFIKLYATSVAGVDAVARTEATAGDAGLDAVLKLANWDDEKSFGSAVWFLSTQCSDEIRSGLTTRGIDGWHDFLVACVGTTVVAERDMVWVATTQIMNDFVS